MGGTIREETIVSGFLYPQKFLNFFTGQVAKIPPFKELDLPLPVFDGLDLKQEQQPCRFAKCTSSMDVLDLYESGEWTAANSPSSELFDDVDIDLSSVSDIEDPYISDFSIDFAPYLDNATLNSSPDDLYKYITSPKEAKVIREIESLEPFLPEEDLGYIPQDLAVKVENKLPITGRVDKTHRSPAKSGEGRSAQPEGKTSKRSSTAQSPVLPAKKHCIGQETVD